MIRLLFNSLIVLILIIGCSTQLKSKKEIHDNIEMLYGRISTDQLYFDFPEWKLVEESYIPDPETLTRIASYNQEINVLTFLGTWCGDSEMNVPAFIKILKSLPDTNAFNLELWAVDRKKNLENKLNEIYQIERVPTFIFLKSDIEIGRIVESPQNSLEADMVQILSENES